MPDPSPMYQHFVPKFLLRNFAHRYKPPPNDGNKKSRRKKKDEKGRYPGDWVVSRIDLLSEAASILETPVKRILGQMDMYRDFAASSAKQQRVEAMFNKLETEASRIFRKITKAFDEKQSGLWLTRDERNKLRKFLFLLKYRGCMFYNRFSHEDPEKYNSDDKKEMREYMHEKGFQTPLAVWFDNLEKIMNLKMDASLEWTRELVTTIYPPDAWWFINHTQQMYMAICTPENPEDEFILTDNAYNVHEGPTDVILRAAGDWEKGSWLNLHEFAPVSPRLILVLRSILLPVAEEDANEHIRHKRELWKFMAMDSIFAPGTQSLLQDLPVSKARNTYSKVVDGRLVLLDGEDGVTRSMAHKFFFSFYPIPEKQVNLINALLLDNVYRSTSVVFNNQDSLSKTLEWYLTAQITIGDSLADNAELRQACIKKLVYVSKSLGSTKEAVWRTPEYRKLDNMDEHFFYRQEFSREAEEVYGASEKSDHDPLRIYKVLGGSRTKLAYDMDQSELMRVLRVKIDSWSQGVDEGIRDRNRQLLVATYLQVPPCRLWLWLWRLRFMILGPQDETRTWPQNAEDVIAQAHSIIDPERLTHMMYVSCQNDIEMKQNGGFNPWALPISAGVGIGVLPKIKAIVFDIPGNISDCAIPEVAQLASRLRADIIKRQAHRTGWCAKLGLPEEASVELLTRIRVRAKFCTALKGRSEVSDLKKLKEVFFSVTFPTPPTGEDD